jgi:hypothetical protein
VGKKRKDSEVKCRPTGFEAALLTFLVAAFIYQLFIPPSVGMADNGDYWRFIFPLGLRHRALPEDQAVNWVDPKYAITAKGPQGYVSSALLVFGLGLSLNDVVSKDGLYDIRVNGAVFTALALCGFALLLYGLRGFDPWMRYGAAVFVALLCVDVGNAAYFNSFYGEPVEFVFFLLFAGSGLLAFGSKNPRGYHVAFLSLTGVLFMASKAQTYPMAVVPAFLLAVLSRRFGSRKVLVLGVAAAVLAISLLLLLGSDPYSRNNHRWQSVFWTLLRYSPNPDLDMQELGLRPEYKQYIGTVSFAFPAEVVAEVVKDIGHEKIAWFYVRRPFQFLDTLRRVSARWVARPELGNFDRLAGLPPKGRSHAFNVWSSFKQGWTPPTVGGLLALPLILLVGLIALWLRSGSELYAYALTFPLVAVGQFVIVAIGEGVANPDKHLYLYNVAIDGCAVVVFVGACGVLGRMVEGRSWVRARHPVASRSVSSAG